MPGLKATKSIIETAWNIWRDIERKNLPLAAAGITYYFVLSVFPALALFSAVLLYLPTQKGLPEVISGLGYVVPPQAISLIEELLTQTSQHRTGLLSFGIAATLWLASVGFKGLILGLDMVYGSPTQRPLWVSRILALLLTIAVGALLLIGVILTLVGPVLWTHLSTVMAVESPWFRLWPYLQWLVSALVLFTAIALLYLLGPSTTVSKRRIFPGALAATAIWLVLAWALGFYFSHSGALNLARFYGLLAAPVALMSWLYCNATAILIGAEINTRLDSVRRLGPSTPL